MTFCIYETCVQPLHSKVVARIVHGISQNTFMAVTLHCNGLLCTQFKIVILA